MSFFDLGRPSTRSLPVDAIHFRSSAFPHLPSTDSPGDTPSRPSIRTMLVLTFSPALRPKQTEAEIRSRDNRTLARWRVSVLSDTKGSGGTAPPCSLGADSRASPDGSAQDIAGQRGGRTPVRIAPGLGFRRWRGLMGSTGAQPLLILAVVSLISTKTSPSRANALCTSEMVWACTT